MNQGQKTETWRGGRVDNNLDPVEVKQELCKECGGITRMLVDQREIGWKEALLRLPVAPDAWCICG